MLPTTSRIDCGLGLLMPTFPFDSMVNRPPGTPGPSTLNGPELLRDNPPSPRISPLTCRRKVGVKPAPIPTRPEVSIVIAALLGLLGVPVFEVINRRDPVLAR